MKTKKYWLLACLVALSIFSGCYFNIGNNGVRGSGIVKTDSRKVAGFSSISFKSVGMVKVQQTGKESLTISAEDNLLPLLEGRVVDRTLYLGTVNDAAINPTKPIEFVVQVKSLEGLHLNGFGSIEARGIQSKQLSVSQDGVGSMTIAGSADVLDLALSGVGGFQGEEFKTKQATVKSSGVGSAVVNVSEQLDADVSGAGSVEYVGSPQVQESVRGVGSVKKR